MLKGPLIHGRFRDTKLGTDRWAVVFYSYTSAMMTVIVDHLKTREEAASIRDGLNSASGVTDQIKSRKSSQRNSRS